jgi:hypothetical protein
MHSRSDSVSAILYDTGTQDKNHCESHGPGGKHHVTATVIVILVARRHSQRRTLAVTTDGTRALGACPSAVRPCVCSSWFGGLWEELAAVLPIASWR